MASDKVQDHIEEELEHLRDEVRALREEQERQKQSNKDVAPKKEPGDSAEKKPTSDRKSHRLRNIVIAAAVLIVAVIGLLWWLHARRFESTDDAQVDGHINAVTARVAGTITAVYVEENQTVQQGQALVDLDPARLQCVGGSGSQPIAPGTGTDSRGAA